ncbi:MAG: pyruvate, phosphate dikinase, partial [Coriobacteriales bacterium]|nr:pyruvate, phosphate dikinase [Coriobacteriales bacterium]
FRTLGVRANADNPADAQLSREFGAAGIGLCRTEHMFLGERKAIVQSFILSDDPAVREKALDDLLAVQTEDFYGMFKAMDGLPVVVRLLDPPLHEFLDDPRSLEVEITRLELTTQDADLITTKRRLLSRIDSMAEMNPMLGLRGVRLAILNPDLAAMQVRAIATAVARLLKEGFTPEAEIMIPLVSVTPELEALRSETEAVLNEVADEFGIDSVRDLPIGTMIELPRAAVTADDIARHADFFSFGTNDLTQTAFGFSRDDVESKFIPRYLERKLIPFNPFETIDPGVAMLVDMACKLGREGNAGITLGVCGEHGGDPDSVKAFHTIGLDYVSCSPYRVPLARLAAGQAALAESFAISDNR